VRPGKLDLLDEVETGHAGLWHTIYVNGLAHEFSSGAPVPREYLRIILVVTVYVDLREYIIGDDLRRIAWRVSARLGTWMVRQMAQEQVRSVLFILDTRTPPALEELGQIDAFHRYLIDFEEAIELVASLSVLLLSREFTVGLLTPTAYVEGGQGTSHQRRILDELARIQPATMQEHHDLEDRARQFDGQPMSLLFVTPDRDQWGARSPLGTARILDPREMIYA